MSKPKINILNMSGKEVGSLELSENVFAAPLKKHIVHGVVVWQLNKRRAGTHSVLTKGEMQRSGKKPFAQKGTGRARAGTSSSPLWVGGAVAHGPKPRSYESRLPKRARKQALLGILSQKLGAGELKVVDSLALTTGKTKDFISSLKSMGLKDAKKVLFVDSEWDSGFERAARNVANVNRLTLDGLNVYDLMNSTVVVFSGRAVSALEQRFNS